MYISRFKYIYQDLNIYVKIQIHISIFKYIYISRFKNIYQDLNIYIKIQYIYIKTRSHPDARRLDKVQSHAIYCTADQCKKGRAQLALYVNMAGRQTTELNNTAEFNESTITAIVRRVYSSLNEVQPASEARATPNLGVRTNTSNSVEEEMSQRFSLPRGSPRGQGRSLTSLGNRPILDNSTRYNPQVNYGNSRLAKEKDKAKLLKRRKQF